MQNKDNKTMSHLTKEFFLYIYPIFITVFWGWTWAQKIYLRQKKSVFVLAFFSYFLIFIFALSLPSVGAVMFLILISINLIEAIVLLFNCGRKNEYKLSGVNANPLGVKKMVVVSVAYVVSCTALVINFNSPIIEFFSKAYAQSTSVALPFQIVDIIDNRSPTATQLANESYQELYAKLDNDEYVEIPVLRRKKELQNKAIKYYQSENYLATLSIFQSENNLEKSDEYINKIQNKATSFVDENNESHYLTALQIFRHLNVFDKKEQYIEKLHNETVICLENAEYDIAAPIIQYLNDEFSSRYAPVINTYSQLGQDKYTSITTDPFSEFGINQAEKLFERNKLLAAFSIANYVYPTDESINLMSRIVNSVTEKYADAKPADFAYFGEIFTKLGEKNEFKQLFRESDENKQPNDKPETATPIFANTTYTANLSDNYNKENDWFVFDAPYYGIINVVLTTKNQYNSSLYWDFYVYPESSVKQGNLYADNSLFHQFVNGDETDTNSGNIPVSAGKYYVRIESSDAWSNDDYSVRVNYYPNGEGEIPDSEATFTKPTREFEPNESASQATSVNVGGQISGNLSDNFYNEVDWYKFSVPNDSVIKVSLFTPQQQDNSRYWDFYVYNQNAETELYHEFINGNTTNTIADNLQVSAGVYYIRLESSNRHTTDEYSIRVDYVDY